MTRAEFAVEILFLGASIQKFLTDESRDAYFEFFQDMPQDIFHASVRRAAAEQEYPTFPTVAMLLRIVNDTKQGTVKPMTGAEAWGIAIKACGNCDVEQVGSKERAFKGMPPLIERAISQFGFRSLYVLPNSAVETARAQFIKLFEALQEREQKLGRLPAPIREAIAAMGEPRVLPRGAARAIARIGTEKTAPGIGGTP
jgi:hypothetical protein